MSLVDDYVELLLEANKTTNLTRIASPEEARILHVEDSLAGLHLINEAPEGLYGDLGSGGGFPGVPLGLASGRETLLIDSVGKKMAILAIILKKIGADDRIKTYVGRIEELALERPEEFSVLTARALAQLSSLIELASPLLSKNGWLICYKANASDDEIHLSVALEGKTGMRLIKDEKFCLSDGDTQRRLMVYEKVSEPSVHLPRRVGMAQKRPLKP